MTTIASPVLWHDVECGAYSADLDAWAQLAQAGGGPVLDLGCGTGRVALHLGRRGHRVFGLDSEPLLLEGLLERAPGLPIQAAVGDARDFELGAEFPLVIAPMQLIQLFDGAGERQAFLRCVGRHLTRAGCAAFAIVESMPDADDASPPLPDTRESEGWVYSSLPVAIGIGPEEIRIRRLRQTVSPAGELGEETDEVSLRQLDSSRLEREGLAAGLRPCGRLQVPATADHVGSTIVLMRRLR